MDLQKKYRSISKVNAHYNLVVKQISRINTESSVFMRFIRSRGDKIRTCDLCVPNAALYQTEPHLENEPHSL